MVGYCGEGLSTNVWLESDHGRLLWWGSVHHGVGSDHGRLLWWGSVNHGVGMDHGRLLW